MKQKIAIVASLTTLFGAFFWLWASTKYSEEGYEPFLVFVSAFSALLIVLSIEIRQLTNCNRKIKNELFISSPIYSVPESDFENIQQLVHNVRDAFVDYLDFQKRNIYVPGKGTGSAIQPLMCADDGLKLLHETRYFVMIYPQKIVTGCLVEIGYAIALNIPCVVFVKKSKNLPNILRDIDLLEHHNVTVHTYKEDADIIEFIKIRKRRLFNQTKAEEKQ